MTGYAQLPPRLAAVKDADKDKYGSRDRLDVILTALHGRDLGTVADIGGNAGYFSLSLVDANAARSSVIYEVSAPAIATGRNLAERMGLTDRVRFVECAVDLDFICSLPACDTIICLNLLHHAGNRFDIELVARIGWERYATEWLTAMRKKSPCAIFGIGFESRKPKHWSADPATRPAALARIVQAAGWSITYDANVSDIRRLGVPSANGRYTLGGSKLQAEPSLSLIDRIRKKASRITGFNLRKPSTFDRLSRYHIYILQ